MSDDREPGEFCRPPSDYSSDDRPSSSTCGTCNGYGNMPGNWRLACPTCGGSGKVGYTPDPERSCPWGPTSDSGIS